MRDQAKIRRCDWTGFGGNVDQAISNESGGCFLSAESGNRGDKSVMASWVYIPEVAEEETRLNANDRLRRFVPVEELEEREEREVTGPRYIALKGTVDEALTELFRKSPKYVIEAYKMSDKTGRLDVLNRLPRVVAGLIKDGVYSTQLFQQTSNGNGYSCYRILKGYASAERGVIGPEGGIACRILEFLQAGQAQAA